MISQEFDYQRPTTIAEAVKALGAAREAKVLAGGHSLLPLMKLGLAQPGTLIDIGGIGALREIRSGSGGEITIGALATHEQVAADAGITKSLAALAEAAASVGDVQVRARGTIGGSLAHADPAADEPAAILAFDATLVAIGPKGERTIKATEFFKGTFETALAKDEILTEIRIAAPAARTGSAYLSFPHPASRFAVVGVAAVVTKGADGTIAKAQVAVTGAAERPFRAGAAEKAIVGSRGDAAAIAKAAGAAAAGLTALDDLGASATFRTHLVGVFTKRAVTTALERAT
ncbi:MAG TPA: xanthine dehydrogenase family protein subunit M [Candidatus Limnocylindria bacterium]|nr:xanthine dehydrogenase family protein subunit M [Candidatus Limnocylindria bacterium]